MTAVPYAAYPISLTNLEEEHSMQLSLFDEHKWRNRQLGEQWIHLE